MRPVKGYQKTCIKRSTLQEFVIPKNTDLLRTKCSASANFVKPINFNLSAITARSFLQGTIVFLSLSSQYSLACRSGGGYNWHGPETTTQPIYDDDSVEVTVHPSNISKGLSHLDRNLKISMGGWVPPSDVEAQWREWLAEWSVKNNNTDYIDPADKARFEKERVPGSGFPSEWLDLGEGYIGADPPPWGYTIKNTGKSPECSLRPRIGNCSKEIARWAYNPYMDKCYNFTWSGCGGNGNNFLTELACENRCLAPSAIGGGCDPVLPPFVQE